jgi:hypothetical protein
MTYRVLVVIKPTNILPQNRTEAERSELARQPSSRHTKDEILDGNRHSRDNSDNKEPKRIAITRMAFRRITWQREPNNCLCIYNTHGRVDHTRNHGREATPPVKRPAVPVDEPHALKQIEKAVVLGSVTCAFLFACRKDLRCERAVAGRGTLERLHVLNGYAALFGWGRGGGLGRVVVVRVGWLRLVFPLLLAQLLGLDKGSIVAVGVAQQLVVGTLFENPTIREMLVWRIHKPGDNVHSVTHDIDLISILDRRQPVRNSDSRTTCGSLVKGILDNPLGLGIQR